MRSTRSAEPDLEQSGRLAHVAVADDDVQAAVEVGIGMRLVAGVDDRPRPGGGARDALPHVVGTLAQAVHRPARGLQDLAGPGDELAGDEERDEPIGQPGELATALHEVVLVAAVGVARRVGVVLEQVDVAVDALLPQAPLGVDHQPLEDPLAGAVVGDQLRDGVALGGGVLGVAADVEVQARPVGQEDVAAAAPGHHAPEQVAGHLVRAEPALAVERARDAVLGLDPEDPAVHVPTVRGTTPCGSPTTRAGPRGARCRGAGRCDGGARGRGRRPRAGPA